MSTKKNTIRLVTLGLAGCLLMAAPLRGQVRKLHTRDMTRLSHIQVADYLKRSDVIFIPIGAVETNGIMPSDRDYVTPALRENEPFRTQAELDAEIASLELDMKSAAANLDFERAA